jgi:hypothetical protein
VTKAIRVLLTSLLLGTALLAGAQDRVRVAVPFDFHVNNATLPAGTYTVTRVFDRDNILLKITGDQGETPIAFVTNLTDAANAEPGLSFHRYGEEYFLSGVKTESGTHSLPRSRQERMTLSKGTGSEVMVGTR